MKKLLIKGIKLYQSMPISSHKCCKLVPTCSNYAIEAIEEYGAFKGTIMSIKRILRCNSFNKNIYDPVIKKECKSEKNN